VSISTIVAKFKVGETVYVPSRLLPNPESAASAMTSAKVREQKQRSVRLNIQDADGNDIEVATKLVHGKHLGILILRIGDFETEDSTLVVCPAINWL
jgi:hypothetical protein